MIFPTGYVMQADPLEANDFSGNSDIIAVLMMLALLNIVKSALLTHQIVHESVKAYLSQSINAATEDVSLLSRKERESCTAN